LTVEALARCVSISVEDTGFGMEKKHLPRIFEKFYRVKDENTRFITGTGLGLPIVKSLVEALNGTISVESELGKGTIFTVTVPYP
jgi:signal transduction histidine kinase